MMKKLNKDTYEYLKDILDLTGVFSLVTECVYVHPYKSEA